MSPRGRTYRISERSRTIPAVVVDAGMPTSLAVLRSLGRRQVPIIGVFADGPQPSPFRPVVAASRFLTRQVHCRVGPDGAELIQCLLELGAELKTRGILFPTSDRDVLLVSEHRNRLEPFYRFNLPDHETLQKLIHKDRFYRWAQDVNLPIPKTFFPDSPHRIEEISRRISYPCILKPSVRDETWAQSFQEQKVFHCAGPQQLQSRYRSIRSGFSDCVVQEVIGGKESNLWCAFTYLDRDGTPLGLAICKKLRQWPPHFGNTVLAVAAWSHDIERLTLNICEKLHLRGYVSIEFKWHAPDQSFRVIEITPGRLNRQVGIAAAQGPGIPNLWYNHLAGRPAAGPSRRQTGFKWLSESQELLSLPRYLKNRELSVAAWLRSYRGLRYCEVFARQDLRPFFRFLRAGPARLFAPTSRGTR